MRAVSIAVSENLRCPPRLPVGAGFQLSIASGESQIVMSPTAAAVEARDGGAENGAQGLRELLRTSSR